MRLNKIMILAVTLGLSAAVQAKDVPEFNPNAGKNLTGVNMSKHAEFGEYKLEPTLRQVPSAIASAQKVVSAKGAMSMVQTDEPEDITSVGSVVRNMLTNELTTLTGNITVLINKNADLSELAQQSGMEVVNVFSEPGVAILRIKEGSDLLNAFNQLKASDLILESKIEVADVIYSAQ